MATKKIMTAQPAVLHALLEHLTEALVVYVCHQIDSGAQVRCVHNLSRRQLCGMSIRYPLHGISSFGGGAAIQTCFHHLSACTMRFELYCLVSELRHVLCHVRQVVQLFDSWAGLLSPAQFQEFSLPYAQRVIDGVRAVYPDTPLIFHANGGAVPYSCPSGLTTNAAPKPALLQSQTVISR